MRVSRRMARGVRVAGFALLSCVVAGSMEVVSSAEFSSPPDIGDRVVALSWPADPDDAVFTGNIVLEVDQEYPFLHGVDRPVVDLVSFFGVQEILSYAQGEDAILRWKRSDGELIQSVPIQSDLDPVDLTLHGSNRFALGAFPDGSVELWDLQNENAPSRTASVSSLPLKQVKFLPRIQDEEDLRFIAAGEDTLVYYMDSLTDVRFTMTVPGGGTEAIAVSPNSSFLVTGGIDNRLRVWNIDTRPNSPLTFFVNHRGTVSDIAVDPTSSRMASVDETGQVIVSRLRTGQVLAQFDVDASEGPAKLAFSLPDGAVLSVAQGNGVISVHDGFTGQLFQEEQISPDGITAYVIGQDGARTVAGDRDGRVRIVRAGRCQPSLVDPICFGGYKIWRNTVADTAGAVLLREYRFDSDTWTLTDETHHFVDPDSLILRVVPPGEEDPTDELRRSGPHNGVPYFYGLTRFDRHFLNGSVFDVNRNTIIDGFYRDPGSIDATPIIPTRDARGNLPLLGEITVVPNPYELGEVEWDAVGGEHVEFRNLPESATIQILNMAGDLVRTIEHGRDRYGVARAAEPWDLRNSSGKRVTSGVYIYQIETPTGEVVRGHFIVVL